MTLDMRMARVAAWWVVAGCVEPAPEVATFHDGVDDLLAARCTGCHQAGGIGPFALDEYDAARTWAEASLASMEARQMPPWLVADDGSCQTYADSQWLTDEDLATFRQWVSDGTVEGASDGEPRVSPAIVLDGLSQTLAIDAFVPEIVGGQRAEYDEYRCFLMDPGSVIDRYITGYDVVPGNEAIVHHVLAFTVTPETESEVTGQSNGERMAELDAMSPDRAGWPCFTEAGDGVRIDTEPVSWAPGQGAVNYPGDVGVRLSKDQVVVMQVHYNLSDPATHGQSDTTALVLEIAPKVDREAFLLLYDNFITSGFGVVPAEIPPGQERWTYTYQLDGDALRHDVGDAWAKLPSYEILGILPHMHERGRTWRIDHVGDDGTSCLARVDRWDFNWQRMYFYQEPIEVLPGETFEVECSWNTEGDDEPIFPGWGTRNEMCLVGFLVAAHEG